MAIDHYDLATGFLSRENRAGTCTLQAFQGEFWQWDGLVYRPISRNRIKQRLLCWLQSSRSLTDPRVAEDVFTWVEAILHQSPPPRQPCWLPSPGVESLFTPEELNHEWLVVKNGLLDVSEGPTLHPMTPRWFSSLLIPVEWKPEATCPTWLRVLDEWMQGDEELISFLQEWCGYCLVPDTSHDLALFLEGEGSNGKTTFCDVLEMLLGRENCSAVPLERWNSEFGLGDTLHRLVNFATETDGRKPLPANSLKRYISGDTFTFSRKYLPGVTASPTARLVISWNRRPSVTDESEGFWRRVQLIPWRTTFTRDSRDEYLGEKLRLELPGVLRWAVEGLVRIRRCRKFTRPSVVGRITEQFRRETDPVRSFVSTFMEPERDSFLAKDSVYTTFCEWCGDQDLLPPERAVFSRALLRLMPGVTACRVRTPAGRTPVFQGVGWSSAGKQLIQGDLM